MIRQKIAVLGGTFDPPTIGHQRLIEKASSMFDELVVVISNNPSKSPLFSEEERLVMTRYITKHLKNTRVECLPENQYLVNHAKRNLRASFLVRGIRNGFDMAYETDINNTNKLIESKVETIYLMPDHGHEMVSSSWVKSLVGHVNWVHVLEGKVSPLAIHKLKRKYLKGRFLALCSRIRTLDRSINNPDMAKILWDQIERAYEANGRDYHNLDHIDFGLEYLDSISVAKHLKDLIEFAWFYHDVELNVSDPEMYSAFCAQKALCPSMEPSLNETAISTKSMVTKLILATKHKGDENQTYTYEEKIIRKMDLFVLAHNNKEYDEYASNVKEEYYHNMVNVDKTCASRFEFETTWVKGRIEFLNEMLDKPYIFPEDSENKNIEEAARKNMKREMERLQQSMNQEVGDGEGI